MSPVLFFFPQDCFDYQGLLWLRIHFRISFLSLPSFFSLNVCYNSAVKPSGCGLFFDVKRFVMAPISLLVTGLLRFSIFLWFNLGRLDVSRNLSILGFPICGHIIVCNSIYLCISVIWVLMSSLLFLVFFVVY